jgi:hypothetical protein
MLTKNIDMMKAETAAHIAARAVVQGQYWERGRGCFIGCLTHSDRADAVTDTFGMPLVLVRIAESIFEDLSRKDARAFFAAVPEAIERDGKDLSRVYWLFLDDIMRNLPRQTGKVQVAVNRVIDGLGMILRGEEWVDAEDAGDAAREAGESRSERGAVYSAGTAAYVAYAIGRDNENFVPVVLRLARAAGASRKVLEVRRQRDAFLRLLRETK